MTILTNIPTRIVGGLKRALGQFLLLPLTVVVGFIAVTILVYWADDAWSEGNVPQGFSWLGKMLGDSTSLATLLGTIASSIITVTSITFSLLLIALQQGSSALTTQVTDQFLMRRSNQFYFGYFVGLSVFVLLSLVTASSIHRPVFGASIIVVLTIVALCMIVVLIYNTIDQMRPTQIVRAIHHHILAARERQSAMLAATRRTPRADWTVVGQLRSAETGHVVAIDADKMRAATARAGCGEVEVELRVPLGRYVAFNDPLVTLRARTAGVLDPDMLDRLRGAVFGALKFDDARDLRGDASYGIDQLSTIAWTSISTAKSNPAPAQAVIQSLRDVLARWGEAGGEIAGDPASLVVVADAAPMTAIAAFEEIILVASESMQSQSVAHAFRTVSALLATDQPSWRARLAEVVERSLSSLGEHVLTSDLEAALGQLAGSLEASGCVACGEKVRTATALLAQSVGVLNSRSTRVPGAG